MGEADGAPVAATSHGAMKLIRRRVLQQCPSDARTDPIRNVVLESSSPVRPLIEAGAVYAAIVLAFRPLALAFGAGPASSAITQFLVLTLAPVAWILLRRHDPADFGLRFKTPGSAFRLAFRAYLIVGPACMVFPLIGWVAVAAPLPSSSPSPPWQLPPAR